MPGTPPTSAPLGWAQAASSWFRKDYDVLGRVFVVTATVRLVLAIHTVVVSSWFIYPTARNQPGLVVAMVVIVVWTISVTLLLRRPTDRSLWVHLADPRDPAGHGASLRAELPGGILDDWLLPVCGCAAGNRRGDRRHRGHRDTTAGDPAAGDDRSD